MKRILVTCTICISKPPFKSPFHRFQLQISYHQGTPFKFRHMFIYILIYIIWKSVHGCIVKMVNEFANFVCFVSMLTSNIIGKMKILQDLLRTSARKCVLNTSVSNSIISILVMRNTRQFTNGHDKLYSKEDFHFFWCSVSASSTLLSIILSITLLPQHCCSTLFYFL